MNITRYLIVLCCLLGQACATTAQYRPLQLQQTGHWRLEGRLTLFTSPMGTQSADFIVLRSSEYGTRVELMGPAGTPIYLAFLRPESFELYSVPDGVLIRDRPEPVLDAAQQNLLALIATIFTATVDYLSGFEPPAMFAAKKAGNGYRFEKGDLTILWREEKARLSEIVIRAGASTVFMERRSRDGAYMVHFGDMIPVLAMQIDYFEPNANLKGARWQLQIPPSSRVLSLSEYLHLR